MNEDVSRQARRDALVHAQSVFGVAQARRDAGVGSDVRVELLAVREVIASRGVPGEPGSSEHAAGESERAAIIDAIDSALRGAGAATGFDVLTVAELMIQERLKAVMF